MLKSDALQCHTLPCDLVTDKYPQHLILEESWSDEWCHQSPKHVSYIHKAGFQPTGYTTVGAEAVITKKAESEELGRDQSSATWFDVDLSLWSHQKSGQF